MKNTIGLYLHIPFCEKKCHYCDFLTFANYDDRIDDYVDYLTKEMALYRDEHYQLDTIYFGGGTPSYLSLPLMRQIIQGIYQNFEVLPDCEIAIEMNPESVTEEKITGYLDLGFNRFSMGVQSFDDNVLKVMGRLHHAKDVQEKVAILRDHQIDNFSLDMMFNNPNQSFEVLKEDVSALLELNPPHISYYSLMIKDKTPFARWHHTGKIQLSDDDEERDMYHYIQQTLKQSGYEQYEISNFAKAPHYQSRHNKKYWQLKDYLGIGLGAASNIGLRRFSNSRRFDQYFQMIDQGQRPIVYMEAMDMEAREKEYIMLNLRLRQGFDIREINRIYQIDFCQKYQDALMKHQRYGVIEIEDDWIRFTDYGYDIGNQFYLDIL